MDYSTKSDIKEFISNTGAVTFNTQEIKSDEVLNDMMDWMVSVTRNVGGTLAMVATETPKSSRNESLQIVHLTGDIPWIVSYIKDHPEQAILCLLFSLAIGICCILLAILFCVCCRWRRTKRRGEFKVTKINSSASAAGSREADNLLGSNGVYTNTSGARVYSSPRLIRAEYARGISTSSGGGNTPSSTLNQPSNPNFVGLYISQPPKSRWSRASDAVWPVPPTSLPTAATIATGNLRHPTGVATLPSHQKFLDEPDTGSNRQTMPSNSPFLPSLATLLAEDRQSLLQKPQGNDLGPYSVQSTFAMTNSSTDFLFNRQSTTMNPDNRHTLQQHPSIKTTPTNFSPVNSYRETSGISDIGIDPSLLRNPPLHSSTPQKKSISQPHPAGYADPSYHHPHPQQHHSFMGPGQLLSPPILPAPATSPWPTRNSQIMADEDA